MVSDISWHFLYDGVVERFDIPQCTLILVRQEVDGSSTSSKSAPSANPGIKMYI